MARQTSPPIACRQRRRTPRRSARSPIAWPRGRRCASARRAPITRGGARAPIAPIRSSILRAEDADRMPELVPIRYGRMLASPFAFYRGAAGIMAADLATTPDQRHPRAGLRRLPSAQLRRLRDARAPADLRHQRLRRDPSGALGVGRQASRRLVRAGRPLDRPLRRQGPRRRRGLRAQLPQARGRVRHDGSALGLVRADHRGGLPGGHPQGPPGGHPRQDRAGDKAQRLGRRVSEAHPDGRRPARHPRRAAADLPSGGHPARRFRTARPAGAARLPGRRCPTTGARCSTATGTSTSPSRWWASAASGAAAGSA